MRTLAFVNHLFFDAENPWVWRDVLFDSQSDLSLDDIEGRLNTLLGRLEQGMKVVGPLHYYYREARSRWGLGRLRTGICGLLARSGDLKSLILSDMLGLNPLPPHDQQQHLRPHPSGGTKC